LLEPVKLHGLKMLQPLQLENCVKC